MQHSFDVDIAKEYGVHCAIILNHLEFWITKNEANGQNFFEGRYWTFNSAEAFSKLFPYMSARQINYALQKLRDSGIVMTGNFNAVSYDRTLWYAFTDFGKSILQNREIHLTNLSNGNDGIAKPIPDINTDIKPDNKPDIEDTPSADATGSPAPSSPPIRHKYGQYKNVLLTDQDMDKLKAEFPGDYESRIERLSEYIASTGKKYKNHLATIRNWARNDKKGGKQDGKRGGYVSGNHGAIEESGAYGKFI